MVSPLLCTIMCLAGMASLVEFQDFNLNHLPPHHSVMMPTIPEMQTLEEIMAQDVNVEPLPTPPLSPDHDICCPSPSSESSSHDLDSGDGMEIMAEALLDEMMSYEQLFIEAMDEENGIAGQQGSSFSLEGHFLVQDCMWNSHTYQPRNTISLGANGVYTPAPSPPPQLPSAEQNDREEGEDEEEEDAPTPRNDASSEGSASDHTDCISPNDVFPTCMVMPTLKAEEDSSVEEPTKKVKVQPVRHTRQERARRALEREQRSSRGGERTSSIMTRRASANTNGNSRIHPQASASSESGNEISISTLLVEFNFDTECGGMSALLHTMYSYSLMFISPLSDITYLRELCQLDTQFLHSKYLLQLLLCCLQVYACMLQLSHHSSIYSPLHYRGGNRRGDSQ